jgi:hypothetical protein
MGHSLSRHALVGAAHNENFPVRAELVEALLFLSFKVLIFKNRKAVRQAQGGRKAENQNSIRGVIAASENR